MDNRQSSVQNIWEWFTVCVEQTFSVVTMVQYCFFFGKTPKFLTATNWLLPFLTKNSNVTPINISNIKSGYMGDANLNLDTVNDAARCIDENTDNFPITVRMCDARKWIIFFYWNLNWLRKLILSVRRFLYSRLSIIHLGCLWRNHNNYAYTHVVLKHLRYHTNRVKPCRIAITRFVRLITDVTVYVRVSSRITCYMWSRRYLSVKPRRPFENEMLS